MTKSCNKPCSPGDFRPGGKCDQNGCYDTIKKPPVTKRFFHSIDWKSVFFIVVSVYFFGIIWAALSGDSFANILAIVTLTLIMFVGIPLFQIFLMCKAKRHAKLTATCPRCQFEPMVKTDEVYNCKMCGYAWTNEK